MTRSALSITVYGGVRSGRKRFCGDFTCSSSAEVLVKKKLVTSETMMVLPI
jgi:hypothetical protein